MTYAQTMRLIWIDAMLASVGTIRRADICRMFLISIPQASLDLRAYLNAFPAGIAYDASAKCYRRAGTDNLFDDDALDAVAKASDEVRHWACVEILPARLVSRAAKAT